LKISDRQTATLSVAVFPQKFEYLGLNTFNPQPSTTNLHQRGDQISAEDSYVAKSGALFSSRFAYEEFDADTSPNSQAPYQMLVETTEGGFFNQQNRDTRRVEWQELYHSSPKHFLGEHELKVGFDFSHSSYDGRQQFLPVSIVGTTGSTLETDRLWLANYLFYPTKRSRLVCWRSMHGWAATHPGFRPALRQRLRYQFDAYCSACQLDARIDKRSQNSVKGWSGIVLRPGAVERPSLPQLSGSHNSHL
jgi:hypothetical protein